MRQTPQRTLLAQKIGLNTILIAGPTASGKTELALALARKLGGEIISADSRQVYRGFDAGTAKPHRDESGAVDGVPYHLIDVADPSEVFDAGKFVVLAQTARKDIISRGRLPIVAGGTGLYINALLEGLSPLPRADARVRGRLAGLAEKHGRAWLRQRLSDVDPTAAEKIPANNIQRMIRALEVHELTGRPISSFWNGSQEGIAPETMALVIDWSVEALRERMEIRAEQMWPAMLRETAELLASGHDGTEPGFQSLGYTEAIRCARGEITPEEGLALMTQATFAYAKRQRTWFRHQIEGARLISGGTNETMLSQALALTATLSIAR